MDTEMVFRSGQHSKPGWDKKRATGQHSDACVSRIKKSRQRSVAYMQFVVDLLLLVLVDGSQQVHEARHRGVGQGDLVVLAQAGTGLLLWRDEGNNVL
jgi:hypothetical protein